MLKLPVVALAFVLVLPMYACQASDSTTPVILIYSPNAPGYGDALRGIIEEDGRFHGATIRICERLDDFRVTIFFPDVKVAVVTLATDVGQRLNETLEWFFQNGGGLVGMGFAGSWSASFNASEDVFPVFGTSYRTTKYDPKTKRFIMRLAKVEEDEISRGISSFSIPQHKVILHFNASTNKLEKKYPNSGEYEVLFAEQTTGAPAVIKYRGKGVSVTFATFGGEDIERSPGYYGLFVDQPEFRALFTNSLYWVWSNERKFKESIGRAAKYYEDRADHLQELKQASEKRERKAKDARLMKTLVTILGGGIACVAVYWLAFMWGPTSNLP